MVVISRMLDIVGFGLGWVLGELNKRQCWMEDLWFIFTVFSQ